jgi:predicted nucleic acid-binding protein
MEGRPVSSGISFADGFAAALAQTLGAQAVTGDPEFGALEGEIGILWLREEGE